MKTHFVKTGSNVSIGTHTHPVSAEQGYIINSFPGSLYAHVSSDPASALQIFRAVATADLSNFQYWMKDINTGESGAHTHGHTATPDEKIESIHEKKRIDKIQYEETSEGLVVSGMFNLDNGEAHPFRNLFPWNAYAMNDERLRTEDDFRRGIIIDLKTRWLILNRQERPPARTVSDVKKIEFESVQETIPRSIMPERGGALGEFQLIPVSSRFREK